MVKLLAKLGRFNSVVIFTIITAAASIAVTLIAIAILNSHGLDIRFELAIILTTLVPLVVAPPILWFLVNLILRMYQAEEELRNPASSDSLTGLLSRHRLGRVVRSRHSVCISVFSSERRVPRPNWSFTLI